MKWLAGILVLAPTAALAQTLTVDSGNSPYTIAANQTFSAVTVTTGGTLVVNAILTVSTDLTVEGGGIVTHDAGLTGMKLVVGGTLEVQPTGVIDVTAKGLGSGLTFDTDLQQAVPGAAAYCGGSHGGVGGNGPATYDDPRNPMYLGGGGGPGNCGAVGSNGGGKIAIQTATLRVDGIVRANGDVGRATGCSAGGGGGGGSIRIDATTAFTGAGSVLASGGNSPTGAGGGGRIAIYAGSNSFTGGLSVGGGNGSPSGTFGTVYILVAGQDLQVSNGHTDISSSDSYRSITVAPGGVLHVNGAATVTQPLAIPAGATVIVNDRDAVTSMTLPSRFTGRFVFNVPISWSGDLSVAGELVVNAPLTLSGNLTVEANGRVTHDPADPDSALDVSGTTWIQLNGAIDLVGKGLPSTRSIDPVSSQEVSNIASYAGASHGGRGGGSSNPEYGDARNPIFLGSGGGVGNCSANGGAGGGRMVIHAATLRVDGTLTADGQVGPNSGCSSGGGGSGGSLVIDVTTLSGSGAISASGGNSSTGGGGGGRVFAVYTNFTFTGPTSVVGGTGNPAGSAGTVYFESTAHDLVVANATTAIGAGDVYNSVVLQPGAVLVLVGPAQVTQQIALPASTTVVINTPDALQNTSLGSRFGGTLVINVPFVWNGPMNIDGTLIANDAISFTGNLTVEMNGLITHDAGDADAALITTGNVVVKTGGAIDVSARGLPARTGIDLGTGRPALNVGDYAGGSHGGVGYGSTNPVYGDPLDPTFLGAGGGNGNCSAVGGTGGGKLHVRAATLTVDGRIAARGGDGSGGCTQSGGGAGGSLRFDVQTLAGSGVISINGGNSANYGGGGGRIAAFYSDRTFNGTVEATGGTGVGRGTNGTVHMMSDTRALIVENGTLIIGSGDSFESITLRAGAILEIRGPAHVSQPIDVPPGTKVLLASPDALDGLTIVPNLRGTLHVISDVVFPVDMTLSGTLIVDKMFEVPNLTTAGSALITHTRGLNTMDLRVPGSLDLVAGTSIDADEFGYAAATSLDPSTLQPGPGSGTYNGGSHGSLGGQANTGAPVAAVYDDASDPAYGGSGGGNGNCSAVGGWGGGVLRVTTGSLVLDGTVTAEGGAGTGGCTPAGGGAGGTIALVLGTWSGAGVMHARGGNSGSGGGAGGLIHVSYFDKTFHGPISVVGGTGNPAGGAGTLTEVLRTGPPTIISSPSDTAAVGEVYSYQARAIGSLPISWTLTTGPTGAAIDPTTGALTWTPTTADAASFTIQATNSFGSVEQSFTVEIAAAPTITSTPTLTASVNVPYQYDGDGRAEATGTSPIAFSARSGPTGLSVDQETGQVAWTPDTAGNVTITLAATNAHGEDTQTFVVAVQPAVGDSPTFTSVPALTATVGLPYLYDADGRVEASGALPIAFSVVSGPFELTIDASSGLLQWTPSSEGDTAITLRASNAFGSADQSFTVRVAPDASGAPHIAHTANLVAAVGRFYVYDEDGRASAAGAQPIAWSRTAGPTELRIEPANGVVTWLPTAAGTFDITIRAANDQGTDDYAFTVVVTASAGPEPMPVAVITPTEGDAPLSITADGSRSYAAPEQTIAYYRWNFGDGSPLAYGAQTSHVYQTPGSYVARLRVIDSAGVAADKATSISVFYQGQRPPSARILVTQVDGAESLTVDFSCNCSAGTAPIEAYLWDFGDGDRSEAMQTTHSFGPGSYEVRLTVVDGAGLTASDSVVIRVTGSGNQPPYLVAQGQPLSGAAPLAVDFLATYGDSDGTVTAVAWDFGDGEGSADAAISHTYQMPGTYHVAVKATDDQGLTANAALEVVVSDAAGGHPPQILSIPATRVEAGSAYHYDADDTPAARGDRPLNWSLGKKVGDQTVGAPDGMSVDAASGKIAWTPTRAHVGKVPVVLVARNNAGAVAQEWEIEVGGEPLSGEPGGCGCAAPGAAGRDLAALGLLLLWWVVKRRRPG